MPARKEMDEWPRSGVSVYVRILGDGLAAVRGESPNNKARSLCLNMGNSTLDLPTRDCFKKRTLLFIGYFSYTVRQQTREARKT